jgi:hypothetical protein
LEVKSASVSHETLQASIKEVCDWQLNDINPCCSKHESNSCHCLMSWYPGPIQCCIEQQVVSDAALWLWFRYKPIWSFLVRLLTTMTRSRVDHWEDRCLKKLPKRKHNSYLIVSQISHMVPSSNSNC